MTRLLRYAAALVVLAVAVTVADATRRTADLTAEDSLTLSAQTRRVVAEVDERVKVTAFLAASDPGRSEAGALLNRYRRLNGNIQPRIVDPDAAPGEMRRLGVDPILGGVAFEQGDQIERAPAVTEQDVTAGLARVVRDVDVTVCVATGHGEVALDNELDDGLSGAAGLLRENGYTVEPVDLLTAPAVRPSCRALLLANPTAPLGPAEAAIAAYLAGGGRALVLTDPSSTVDLTPLLAPYGMGVQHGIVLEVDPANRLPEDPLSVVVTRYRSPSPIVRRLPPTVYPSAQGLALTGEDVDGLFVTAVVQTSSDAYLERQPRTPSFDEGQDVAGPLTLAAAADRSENQGGRVVRTRVVAVGDVDFATNALLSLAGNGALLVQSMDWLTLDEDLVTVSPNLPSVRPLLLTQGRLRYARTLMAVIVPALFLFSGVFVWAVRRPR